MDALHIPEDLKPFYEFAFIHCFALCHYCGKEQAFSSEAAMCSDRWYFDMAVAIQNAGWVIPRLQVAACPTCASSNRLRHDPDAHTGFKCVAGSRSANNDVGF